MPKIFPDLNILVLLVVVVSAITACEHEKATTAPPAVAETPPLEPQQSPDTAPEPAATEESTEQTATVESTPPDAEKTAPPEAQVTQSASTNDASIESRSESTNDQTESLALARKSGCLACHAVDKKVVGPPWRDVARRYAGNPDARAQLIEKVSKGGKGNWTDVVGNVAMPPYYPRVSKDNIEKLVDFVLSLSNQ